MEHEETGFKIKFFVLEGLDCGNCAAKMELGIKALDGIREASIDFVTKKLRLEVYDRVDYEKLVREIAGVVNKIESHVNMMELPEKKPAAHASTSEKEEKRKKLRRLQMGTGTVLFAAAIVLGLSPDFELALYLAAYILVGGEVLLKSARNITRGQVFDENFLMSLATIGAFAIGEFSEGVAVMLFYRIGEAFQELAVNRSRKSIKELMNIRPDYANLLTGGQLVQVSPEEVQVGAEVVIKPGERVPLDGRIIEGSSMIDTSALTGESVPREVNEGDEILAGFINKNGVLRINVSKEFGESTVAKILDMVENASSKKSRTENFITKFARYYTPVVVFSALALAFVPPLVVPGEAFADWLYRALIFLVVSCPCALVISIPLGFFGGIGSASRNGILIKGSNYLEALNQVDTIVFDKTGTLTKGVFQVTEIKAVEGLSKAELLKYTAYAESYSSHPIALSIMKAYGKKLESDMVSDYYDVPGFGVKACAEGKSIMAGNAGMMEAGGLAWENVDTTGTVVHVALDNIYSGYIVISDEIKEDAAKAVRLLREAGVKKLAMLTGDIAAVGEKVGSGLGLDEVYSELLPDQKVEKLERIKAETASRGKVVFAGDGINDAPVLARADIGIAMGGLGSDAAIEAADIVIMTDEPSKIASAIKIAKATRKIVWQNIIFAMGVKLVVLLLGAGGLATMWEAVFADVGVALIAVLNSIRVLRLKNI